MDNPATFDLWTVALNKRVQAKKMWCRGVVGGRNGCEWVWWRKGKKIVEKKFGLRAWNITFEALLEKGGWRSWKAGGEKKAKNFFAEKFAKWNWSDYLCTPNSIRGSRKESVEAKRTREGGRPDGGIERLNDKMKVRSGRKLPREPRLPEASRDAGRKARCSLNNC